MSNITGAYQATIKGYHYATWNETRASSFITSLKALKVPIAKGEWSELQKTYINNSDIKAYFGNDLAFLEVDNANYTNFLDEVNVRYKVSVSAALERLKSISESQWAPSKESVAKLYKLIEVTPSDSDSEISEALGL